jgi:hypothetical protein
MDQSELDRQVEKEVLMLFFDQLTIFFKHDCLAPPYLRGGFTISNAAFAKG